MNKLYTITFACLFFLFSFTNVDAQKAILDDVGSQFKKENRRQQPKLKTKYFFEISEQTGREYLKQQDIVDSKGLIKSSGIFADDGNKITDVRYVYNAEGKLERKDEKILGGGDKLISYFNSGGLIEKTERFNATGDSLKETIVYLYNKENVLIEEQLLANGALIKKKVYENEFNKHGNPLQLLTYEVDNAGNRIPHNAPLTINEYDDYGRILQTTIYSNKEKRKMLSWIYFKYQVDNSYKVIKRFGYDEEQKEISRVEISYSENSITYEFYEVCDCPEKTIELKSKLTQQYNSFGELVMEETANESGELIISITYAYDEFGNMIEKLTKDHKNPTKLKKERYIFEFAAEQAKK